MTTPATAMTPPALAASLDGTRGPWLVLIHGWSCHGGLWDDLIPLLTPWARVVTLDLPGHGASATGGATTIAHMAQAVAATLRRLGADTPVLVGHSMGGPVALETAILLGRRCPVVIGIDTFTDAAFYARRPAAEIADRLQAFSADFAGTMSAMVRRITRGGPEPVAAAIADAMAASDPASVLPALRALLEWDIAPRWPLVRCRVETINSAPLAHAAAAVTGLHGLAVHLMENVGHFAMREDPISLAALVREIVGRSGPSGFSGSG